MTKNALKETVRVANDETRTVAEREEARAKLRELAATASVAPRERRGSVNYR